MFLSQQIAISYPRRMKREKYQDLRIELERLWKKTFVTPIVIGALGEISKKLFHYVDLLDSHDVKYFHLQRLALYLVQLQSFAGCYSCQVLDSARAETDSYQFK